MGTKSYDGIIYTEVTLKKSLCTVTRKWKVHWKAHLAALLEHHDREVADVCEQMGESAHHAMKPMMQRHK